MNKLLSFLVVTILLVTACQPDAPSDSTSTANKPKTHSKQAVVETPSGLSYQILGSKGGERKAQFGDFLTLHMQYTTMNDSTIFTSFTKDNPLSFRLQESLFRGVLNDGLTNMAAGDSATMIVVADSLYGERMPKFLKSGEKIKYTIALQKVQTRAEYQKEQDEIRNKQLQVDARVINKYVKEKGLKTVTTASGLQYITQKEGKEDIDLKQPTVLANYTLKTLPGEVEIESSGGVLKELRIQTRGLREGLQLLKQGGQGTLILPSVLAYGNRKRGQIPANGILMYEIKEIKGTGK